MRRSPLDPGPVAALAPHHLVSLLEGALAFAILALLFLLAAALLHQGPPNPVGELSPMPKQGVRSGGRSLPVRAGVTCVTRARLAMAPPLKGPGAGVGTELYAKTTPCKVEFCGIREQAPQAAVRTVPSSREGTVR